MLPRQRWHETLFFDPEKAGPPQIEPHFGTEFWAASREELGSLLARWSSPPLPGSRAAGTEAKLRFPDRNRFLATDFSIQPSNANDQAPPQLDGVEALQHVYASFPSLPLPLPRQPRRLAAYTRLRAWHLQDTTLLTPRCEIWVKLSADGPPFDPKNTRTQVMMALLVLTLSDTLCETTYLAEEASLHLAVSWENYGIDLKVGGFYHKLPLLLDVGIKEILSFAGASAWEGRLRDSSFAARLAANREQLLRTFRNLYLRPSAHCEDLRRILIVPSKQAALDRAHALESIDGPDLASFAQALIPKLRPEILIMGNASIKEAEGLVETLIPSLQAALGEGFGGDGQTPPQHADLRAAVIPNDRTVIWVEESPDVGNRNVAVELYWQLGPFVDQARRCVLLDLFTALVTEPLFDTLRTKQQIGYEVACGVRVTHGVIGFSIWLLSTKVNSAEICARVESFLADFRPRLQDFPSEDLEKHVISLAAGKLEPHRTLVSTQMSAWAELQEQRYVFDRTYREAVALASVRREDVLSVLDTYIIPGAPQRRLAIVAVLGGKAKTSRVAERKAFGKAYPGCQFVDSQADFLASAAFHETSG